PGRSGPLALFGHDRRRSLSETRPRDGPGYWRAQTPFGQRRRGGDHPGGRRRRRKKCPRDVDEIHRRAQPTRTEGRGRRDAAVAARLAEQFREGRAEEELKGGAGASSPPHNVNIARPADAPPHRLRPRTDPYRL